MAWVRRFREAKHHFKIEEGSNPKGPSTYNKVILKEYISILSFYGLGLRLRV